MDPQFQGEGRILLNRMLFQSDRNSNKWSGYLWRINSVWKFMVALSSTGYMGQDLYHCDFSIVYQDNLLGIACSICMQMSGYLEKRLWDILPWLFKVYQLMIWIHRKLIVSLSACRFCLESIFFNLIPNTSKIKCFEDCIMLTHSRRPAYAIHPATWHWSHN